jgi:hypothetical protein
LIDFQKTSVTNVAAQFVVEKITGDGNCLFRSSSQQMVKNENNYKKYRKEICDYIEKNSHLFITQIEALFDFGFEDLEFDKHILNNLSDDELLKIYLTEMKKFYLWRQ